MQFYRSVARALMLIGVFLGWPSGGAIAQPADDATLAAAGIRKIRSKHLTLYTDLPPQQSVDQLPAIFDLAVPSWTKFFDRDRDQLDSWHIVGCVMRDRKRFEDYGLLPASLPPFLHGYQAGDRVWVLEQPSAYYRRHLLLHEGTHAVMQHCFGSTGPAWYREGIAELLGTHRLQDGQLELGHFPQDKQEVEHWGRIKLLREDIEKGRALPILRIMDYRSRDFFKVESYAWCWALAVFSHRHPRLRSTFQQLQQQLDRHADEFTQSFLISLRETPHEVETAWQLFLAHVDYGYDVASEAIVDRTSRPLPAEGATVRIDAAKAWQSTGIMVSKGQRLRVEARGRYQVGQQPKPWWCEPQGVTIEYYQQRPLGILLGAIDDPGSPIIDSPLAEPFAVGRQLERTAERKGVLFLRINERTDGLGDNKGALVVTVKPI